MARAYGREAPATYGRLLARRADGTDALDMIAGLGPRFVLGQAYDCLAEIEPRALRARARTIPMTLSSAVRDRADTWVGGGGAVLLHCPSINDSTYYRGIYDAIKRDLGSLPHRIFGQQRRPVDDPLVLDALSDGELFAALADAPVFVYPSREPRHVHYTPFEAIAVGTPVLFRRGALLDRISGHAGLPGCCASTRELRAKATALLAGDRALAEAIRSTQPVLGEALSPKRARSAWAAVLSQAESVRRR